MTTQEIFAANQVLTVAKAQELKGKRIYTTSPEDRANRACVNEFVVGEIISEWDRAANDLMNDGKFETRQDYWASYMTAEQIETQKTKLVLFAIDGGRWHVAHTKFFNFYDEPTFTGSDADREVYFLEA